MRRMRTKLSGTTGIPSQRTLCALGRFLYPVQYVTAVTLGSKTTKTIKKDLKGR